MSDDSLFREVDEEIRREQAQKLWDRYGIYVLVVSLAVVIGVGGMKGWQYWQHQRSQEAGKAYYEALGKSETIGSDAPTAFDSVKADGHTGFSQLARLQEAGLLARTGKTTEAVAAYDAIAADQSMPVELRDVARVRAAYLLSSTASVEDLKARLEPVNKAGGPWVNASREILATAAWRAGDYKEAGRLIDDLLADPQTPASMRQRAMLLKALVEPKLAGKTGS